MKIAVYSPTCSPVKDGTSIQAARLYERLSTKHDVHLVTYAVDRDVEFDRTLLNMHDGIERLLPDFLEDSGRFKKLSGQNAAARIKELQPSIIHIRGWYQFKAINTIINAAMTVGSKIYWHADGLHECHELYKSKLHYNSLIKEAIQKKVFFVGNSKQDMEIFYSMGASPINVFDVPPFVFDSLDYPRDWSKPRILTLGRFFDFKRHDLVIDIAKAIDPNIDVIVAGASDTEYFPEFMDRNRLRATMVLDPSDNLVRNMYASATHFILASEIESLGVATLEAIKAGCVPLARDVGGIKSYLPQKFLFHSAQELDAKLRFLLNPSVAEESSRELRSVRDSLSDNNILLRIENMYEVSK